MNRRTVLVALVVPLLVTAATWAAETHYGFNRNTPAGYRLGRDLEGVEFALHLCDFERPTMIAMRDGADNPADPANYAAMTTAYGFTSDAEARGAFLEVDSFCGKFNTDASVSGNLATTMQLLARLRS
jgi:hypothetical protein